MTVEVLFEPVPTSAIYLVLSNSVLLRQIAPYLSIQSVLALAATTKYIRALIYGGGDAFRYLNLSRVKRAKICNEPLDHGGFNWRSQRMDEALTQDEFVSGPLRGIFAKLARKEVLIYVQTMILDGLGVTAELVDEIIARDRFRVRMLSIRGCGLNENKLMQVLKYAVRPSRADGMPILKALYCFGPVDSDPAASKRTTQPISSSLDEQTAPSTGVMSSEGAQIGAEWSSSSHNASQPTRAYCDDRWYRPLGRLTRFKPNYGRGWAEVLTDCEAVIAFDAVPCRGPRHDVANIQQLGSDAWLAPAIANVALGAGCAQCGSMPEEPAVFAASPSHHLPLLDPPPTHYSTVRQAQKPHLLGNGNHTAFPPLFVRCEDCLKGRWCERCLHWWCEDCYAASEAGTRKDEVSSPTLGNVISATTAATNIKVHMGLCIENCLVAAMMSGAGSNGMWG